MNENGCVQSVYNSNWLIINQLMHFSYQGMTTRVQLNSPYKPKKEARKPSLVRIAGDIPAHSRILFNCAATPKLL